MHATIEVIVGTYRALADWAWKEGDTKLLVGRSCIPVNLSLELSRTNERTEGRWSGLCADYLTIHASKEETPREGHHHGFRHLRLIVVWGGACCEHHGLGSRSKAINNG